MKTTIAASLLAFFTLSSSTLAAPVQSAAPDASAATAQLVSSVSYDTKFDQGTTSLNTVSCSNGANGLITQGYSTFNSLPGFPFIGGAPTVEGWNSASCGKCYKIHYKNGNIDNTINLLAVDAAPGGFNLGLQAMNRLTNGQAEDLGRVEASYWEVDRAQCGFTN